MKLIAYQVPEDTMLPKDVDENTNEMRNLWSKLESSQGPVQNMKFKIKMSPTLNATDMETIVEQDDGEAEGEQSDVQELPDQTIIEPAQTEDDDKPY